MKKIWLLCLFCCLFLVACAPNFPVLKDSLLDEDTPLKEENILNDIKENSEESLVKDIDDQSEFGENSLSVEEQIENPRYPIVSGCSDDFDGLDWIGFDTWLDIRLAPIEEYYLLEWTGNDELYDRINARDVYTNDPLREIQSMQFVWEEKNPSTYQCFWCDEKGEKTGYDGADEKYLFLDGSYPKLGVKKSELPNYIPLQIIGIQSADELVGYSDGYLVAFPFKFSVDKETFQTVQSKWATSSWIDDSIPSLFDVAGGHRWVRFQNNGTVYDKYLGDDKDWIYYWTYSPIAINRIAKASDFSFVTEEDNYTILVQQFCDK